MDKQIICCKCSGALADDFPLKAIEHYLNEHSFSHYRVEDLCGIAANQKEELQEMITPEKETVLIACNPRALNLLLDYAGVDVENSTIHYVNHRNGDFASIKNKIKDYMQGINEGGDIKKIKSDENWPSWYPLVDYERCTDCGQCADFCLFGVYEKDDNGKVKVVNPHGCKDLCPACARICPASAIVFPKFPDGGAISGTGNIDEGMEKKRLEEDLQNITGGDIYQTLEKRKIKRESIIKKQAMEKAQTEREKALKKINSNLK
jgi:NAD-dependent dihydropyrimidine dehydrogenase PreA subunit